MATETKLGPTDHGRPMTFDEFMGGDYEPGYKYELIDGSLYVSPEANMPEDWVEQWLLDSLKAYSRAYPKSINFVTNKGRVFVPGRPGLTCPEPDLAAYRLPSNPRSLRQLQWQKASPLLVAEVLHEGDAWKDLERNVELFLQVPTIKEYWIVDMRADPDHPSLLVHRRYGREWRFSEIAPGATYSTRSFPGFQLLIDPRG